MGFKKGRILVAIKDIIEFKTFEWFAFLNNVDLKNPVPKILNIELSGYCNCKCIYCPFHGQMNLKKDRRGLMSLNTAQKIANEISLINSIDMIDTTGPGEIFINNRWFEILNIILAKTNIEKLCMYTNGMLLNDENVDKIAKLNVGEIIVEISIDGESPSENDSFRIGAEYSKICDNIRNAQRKWLNKRNLHLVITNCYPAKEEEVKMNNYVVDSKVGKVPYFLKSDFPDIEKVSQKTFFYGDSDFELSDFKKIEVRWSQDYKRCLNLFNRIALDYEGNLLKCSCGNAGIEPIASLDMDIIDIWKNDEELKKARFNFINNINESDFCSYCPGKGIGNYYILVRR